MPDHELDALATEMFRTFACFEYSLKAAGFNNGDGDAQANWSAFARSIPNVFDDPQDERVKAAAEYILSHPPQKQVVTDGALDWRDAAPSTNLRSDELLVYVRRVRNNLFHGGKFNGRWFRPERSRKLLRHSLVILCACLKASPDVKAAYDG